MVSMSAAHDNWGLIGHQQMISLLASRLASGRLSHAYLFTGPPGIGKTALALRLAQAMNCTGPNSPCGECRTCGLIGREAHPDLFMVRPEGRSIKIEAIRELQHMLTLRPFEARYRIAIITDMQMATAQAADALLKTLEEPPHTSRLLLTVDDARHVLPTVASRCQVVPLRPVPAREIAAALIAQEGLSPDEAGKVARMSGGRPGWALDFARGKDAFDQHAAIVDGILAVLRGDRAARFAYSELLARDDNRSLVLDIWQSLWRDVLLLAEGSRVPPVNADHVPALEDLAYRIHAEDARRALRAVGRTIDAIGKNANVRLALDVMLLDMPYL
jgi:DNA polymerase-3 subunit delta'